MQQWHFYDIKKLSKLKLCYSYRNVNALAFISILTLFYCIMLIKVPTNEKKTRNKDYRLECNKENSNRIGWSCDITVFSIEEKLRNRFESAKL